MKSEAFVHYSDAWVTLLGLGLFIGVFVGALVWTSLRENREKYRRIERQPLDEGGLG